MDGVRPGQRVWTTPAPLFCGMPMALDSGRAAFVHADPGYDTSTALRSWRDRGTRPRADGSSDNRTSADTAPRPIHPGGTAAVARREIARVGDAIRGEEEAKARELGSIQGCHRLVETRDLLRSMRPAGYERRPYRMAFEPLRGRRDLTARGRGPLPIHECPCDIGTVVHEKPRSDVAHWRLSQVAGAVAFVPQPRGRP